MLVTSPARAPRVTGYVYALSILVALAGCAGKSPGGTGDGGLRPCTEDWECEVGETCVAGHCAPTGLTDGGQDAGGPPQILVAPTVLTFGNPYVGGEYTQTFTLRNLGGSLLTVSRLDLVDNTPNHDFLVTGPPPPFTLVADPQQSTTITVTLRPTDNGIPSGVVHVISDDPAQLDVPVQLTATVKDDAHLDACVLVGATVADGCTTSPSDGSPLLDLGTFPYGSSSTRVVSLLNGGGGNVAEKIAAVRFTSTGSLTPYVLAAFTLDGSGGELPVTFPYLLNPVDPSGQVAQNELRVRVTFTADGVDGVISGASLEIESDHPDGTRTTIPIVGQIQGCRPGAIDGGVPDGGMDPMTDPNNCGYCGHVCALDNATAKCVGGVCRIDTCLPYFDNCDSLDDNGCESDLRASTANCGHCGEGCLNTHGSTSCQNGVCTPHCDPGYEVCGGNPKDGCMVSLNSVASCGACDFPCTNANGGTSCPSGICRPTCATGFADCDGHPENGCETDLGSLDNCGACGTQCRNDHGTTVCQNKTKCFPTCTGTWWDCNGNANDGCETDLSSAALCGPCTIDAQCPTGFFCNGTQCERKHASGTLCSSPRECSTGNCVDGRCCVSDCTTPCFSCANGAGACNPVANADDIPECTGARTCNAASQCKKKDGQACTAPDGSECASGYCKDGACCSTACTTACYSCATGACLQVAAGEDVPECWDTQTCNAAAQCRKKQGQPCASAGECITNQCWDNRCCNADCSGACKTCSTGTCTSVSGADDPDSCNVTTSTCDTLGNCRLRNGQGCSQGTQCASGVCKDGVCCNEACGDTCKSCNLAGSAGTCSTVRNATDDTCLSPNACDAVGACRGTGGTPCDVAHPCGSGFYCVDGVCCSTLCNAACQTCSTGTCQPVTNGDDITECTGNFTCNGSGQCKLKTGRTCTNPDGSECASGICKDGVCCATACTTACQTCAAGGSLGTCTSIVNAEDVPECSGQSQCNGASQCKRKIGASCSVDGDCLYGKCCGGFCRDTTSDNGHCGGCGQACSNANAVSGSSFCSSSACTAPTCLSGFQNCNSNNWDGCEVNLATDVANCGGCGVHCGNAPNTLPHVVSYTCSGGQCAVAAGGCAAGWYTITGPDTNPDGCECGDLDAGNKSCGAATQIQGAGTCMATCSSTCYANTCCDYYFDPYDYYCYPTSTFYCASGSIDYIYCGAYLCNPYACNPVACAPTTACTLTTVDDLGQNITTNGNLPYLGDEVWFRVNVGNSHWDRSALGGGGNPFNLKIGFAANPSNEFRLQVFNDCSTAAGCGSGSPVVGGTYGAGEFYQYNVVNERPCLTSGTIPAGYGHCVNHAGTYYVKVTRGSASATCSTFTLQVTNGM
jgi:hypothetical protein